MVERPHLVKFSRDLFAVETPVATEGAEMVETEEEVEAQAEGEGVVGKEKAPGTRDAASAPQLLLELARKCALP
jgi:hypothetical protein